MQPLLQQLPALLGVLVGSVATYGMTIWTERRGWRRTQSVRWDERRVAAYMDYARAIKKVISIATQLVAQQGTPPSRYSMALVYQLTDLATAEEERTVCWEAVLMLGSDDAVLAGRRWHDCVFVLELLAGGQPNSMTWDQAVQATSRARGRYYEVTKRDIGLEVQAVENYEWQLGNLPTQAADSDHRRITG